MRKFDYSFLKSGSVPAEFVTLASGISSFCTAADMRKGAYPKIFSELESIAKVQSVKSSNEIEGIVTSDDRIRAIVNEGSAPKTHSEAEIAGYRDALASIHLGYGELDFRRDDILRLHSAIMNYTGTEGGAYKTNDNLIIEEDSSGNRRVRFRPTSAKETPFAMEQLELAYMEARDDADLNQLLLIPCVILDFLCIHPFRDGNGRVSRLLSLLLLYKNGFDVGKYISFEEQINKYKDMYYEALRQSSVNWETGANDYFPFVKNFLTTLYICYKELNDRFSVVSGNRITKKARVEATVLNSIIPISKSEICKILPDVSPTTVEAVLGAMIKNGDIKRIGGGKNSRYIKI